MIFSSRGVPEAISRRAVSHLASRPPAEQGLSECPLSLRRVPGLATVAGILAKNPDRESWARIFSKPLHSQNNNRRGVTLPRLILEFRQVPCHRFIQNP